MAPLDLKVSLLDADMCQAACEPKDCVFLFGVGPIQGLMMKVGQGWQIKKALKLERYLR